MSFTIITAENAAPLLKNGQAIIIDVREPSEFRAEHIEQATNHPLSSFSPKVLNSYETKGKKVIIQCLKGGRAKSACQLLENIDTDFELLLLEGGINGWKEAKLPTVKSSSMLPLDQQVQLTIGILIILSCILGFTVDSNFFYLTGLIGIGLSFAGLTGICAMARVLAKAPWNR